MITTEPSPGTVRARRAITAVAAIAVIAWAVYALVAFEPFDRASEVAAGDADTDADADADAANVEGTETTEDGAAPAIDSEPASATATSDGVLDVAGGDGDDAGEAGSDVTTTRFVDLPTTRILDTREGDDAAPVPPGGGVEADLDGLLPAGVSTVVMSVNVAMAEGPGPITVAAGSGDVTAINVAGPGQMTTNMVFVPYQPGSPVAVTTEGGGHLVVDVVGYFADVTADSDTDTDAEAQTGSNVAAAGRFVPVATQRIAQLVTEIDGREAVIRPLANPAMPASGVTSVLVRITADVGGDGGMVRLGEDLETLPNTMMWAATSGDDRTRQGVAVVPLSELDELAFTYNGGSVLDLDVLGYFTDESALEAESGLFVPVTDADGATVEVDVSAGEPVTIDVAGAVAADDADIGAVPVNVFATAATPGLLFVQGSAQDTPSSATVGLGAGAPRFGFTVTEVDDNGQIVIVSDVDATVSLTMPGYFRR